MKKFGAACRHGFMINFVIHLLLMGKIVDLLALLEILSASKIILRAFP